METQRALILVTNDDGIDSPGLLAAANSLRGLGDILVVAPCHQWSGAGRSFPTHVTGAIHKRPLELQGETIQSYCVDAAPAQVVLHALLELAPRPPSLLVAGINYGENLGTDLWISGTVGAALQGAVGGIPALAVSLQTPKETHNNPSPETDFAASAHFTRLFAQMMLTAQLPTDVDLIKLDIPDDATPATPWRITRASRREYFYAVPIPRDDLSSNGLMDYATHFDHTLVEPDSDIYALAVDRVVAATPLSIDATSRTNLPLLEQQLRQSE